MNNQYYLGIYHQGRRRWEAIGLKVATDPVESRNVWRLTEAIRSKREQ